MKRALLIFLVFGTAVLGPAIVLAVYGYQSIENQATLEQSRRMESYRRLAETTARWLEVAMEREKTAAAAGRRPVPLAEVRAHLGEVRWKQALAALARISPGQTWSVVIPGEDDGRLWQIWLGAPGEAGGEERIGGCAALDLESAVALITSIQTQEGALRLAIEPEPAPRPGEEGARPTQGLYSRPLPPGRSGYQLVVHATAELVEPIDVERVKANYLVFVGLLAVVTLGGIWAIGRTLVSEMQLARARMDFVSGVTHELRTPLTSIRLYAEILQDSGAVQGEAGDTHLETLLEETARLERLVRNVLDASRVRSGRLVSSPEEGDLAEFVTALVAARRKWVERSGFRVELEVAPEVPPALFDPEAMERIVDNLLENAVKYGGVDTREDSRVITVRVGRSAGGGAQVEVCDRGEGLAEGEEGRIFGRFVRGRRGVRTGASGGVGLGLAIVSSLARAQGGRVSAANRKGGGAQFRVELPAA